jgi:uncharacterized membrane protein
MNSTQHSRWGNAGDSRNQQEAWQRWAPLVGGSTLALLGLSRRSKAGWALVAAGGALAVAGTRTSKQQSTPFLGATILVNASPQEAFRFWRDLDNAPRWMNHIESVNELGDRKSKWIAVGPMGVKLHWTAEITDQRDGEYIAWRSLPGSDLNVNGRVEFKQAPGNRGTIVSSRMLYSIANSALRGAASGFIGRQAKFFVRQDMRRFKALLETGEIPTIEGQTHGPRSGVTAVARAFNPDRPLRGDWRAREAVASLRRVS